MKRIACALVLVSMLCTPVASAQNAAGAPATAPAMQADTLKVYLDCPGGGCDIDYIRTEMTFVDYVRDPRTADVHVLVTNRRTGSGGREYTLKFIGRDRFAGTDEELLYNTRPTDTSDMVRQGLVQTLKLGIVRYFAHSALADQVSVSFRNGSGKSGRQTATDPWNFWVFRSSLNGRTGGEQTSNSVSANGSFNASRTTERWKSRLSASASYNRNHYDFSDGTTYTSVVRDYGISASLVKSLGAHWGAGARAQVSSNTYTNQKRVVSLVPSIEYNIFPYAESTRRQLTLRYTIGLSSVTYDELTIYDKLSERLASNSFVVALDLKQPWGTLNTGTELAGYLQDLHKYHASVSGSLDIRLFKGFSLGVGGRTTLIRDQLYLKKGEATPEEILARQRQVATSYQYSFNIGFSYTFGSIYNNVVNTRLSNIF